MDSQAFLTFFIFFFSLLFLDFTYSAAPLARKEWTHELSTGASYPTIDPSKVAQISVHPRAFIYKGFLSDEECDHLIRLGDKLEKALVADKTGKDVVSEARTSYGQFLEKAQDKIVADLEARIAAWTFFPEENGEPFQILRYQHGQKFEPHYDYFFDKANQEYGGQRIATVLIYLSNVEKGGETAFPKGEDTQTKDDSWSDCAKKGFALKPNKGDALLFFDTQPNGTLDWSSLHRACPVIEGEKWSATKWIHIHSYEESEEAEKPDCADDNNNCAFWASTGACEEHRMYMVGSESSRGHCMKSCKACSS